MGRPGGSELRDREHDDPAEALIPADRSLRELAAGDRVRGALVGLTGMLGGLSAMIGR